MKLLIVLIAATCVLLTHAQSSQLIINIKNSGGEVFQEKIATNLSEDVIELEYTSTDGSVITQLIDYKNVR